MYHFAVSERRRIGIALAGIYVSSRIGEDCKVLYNQSRHSF